MSTIDIIRNLCNKNGITISKLEKELGFSNSSLTKSKNISYDRIQKIADYFNVSIDELSDAPKKRIAAVYRPAGVSERPKRNSQNKDKSLNQDSEPINIENVINGMSVSKPPKQLSDMFHSRLSSMLDDVIQQVADDYYLDDYSQELAQFAHDNPSYRVLFDASRKVKPENIAKVMAMLKIMGDDEE